MTIPHPTRIVRLLHIDNLPILLQRDGLHAPNTAPNDGLRYKTIHNLDIQAQRRVQRIPCGPGGTIHDYVPFYSMRPKARQMHRACPSARHGSP